MTTYVAGQTLTITGKFFNASNVLADPSGATLYIRRKQDVRPLLTKTWPADSGFTHPSAGVLQYNWISMLAGDYAYEWRSSDALPAVSKGYFTIEPGLVAT